MLLAVAPTDYRHVIVKVLSFKLREIDVGHVCILASWYWIALHQGLVGQYLRELSYVTVRGKSGRKDRDSFMLLRVKKFIFRAFLSQSESLSYAATP